MDKGCLKTPAKVVFTTHTLITIFSEKLYMSKLNDITEQRHQALPRPEITVCLLIIVRFQQQIKQNLFALEYACSILQKLTEEQQRVSNILVELQSRKKTATPIVANRINEQIRLHRAQLERLRSDTIKLQNAIKDPELITNTARFKERLEQEQLRASHFRAQDLEAELANYSPPQAAALQL